MSQTLTMSERERRARRRKWALALLGVLGLAGAVAFLVWFKLFRQVPTHFDDPADEFKFGSIGNEQYDGIPYWIWLVLPRVFPEHLPGNGGYASLGMVWEEGREVDGKWKPASEVPVGISKKTVGFPRVAMNCVLCHTSVVRKPGEVTPHIYAGGTGNQMNTLGYLKFLFACAHDPRFTPDVLLEPIEYNVTLGPLDKLLYRYLLIPQTKTALLELEKRYAFTDKETPWAVGEIDPFNPVKINVLGMEYDGTVGNSDMQPIWNLGPREGMALHWDGLNTSVQEVVLSSAIGDGARRETIPLGDLKRLENYLKTLPPPKFADLFPDTIDKDLAAKGEPIYKTRCADCHAFSGKRTGTVISVEEVGTDPERHKLWRENAAQQYNNYAKNYPWKFNNFRATDGYNSVPLDGVWIRAPFLHNGSVPTLKDLLDPPAQRPKVFYRGNDLFDPDKVGYVSDVPEDHGRRFFKYDTSLRAQSNGGHTYGTDLPDGDKKALIEYMKTL